MHCCGKERSDPVSKAGYGNALLPNSNRWKEHHNIVVTGNTVPMQERHALRKSKKKKLN